MHVHAKPVSETDRERERESVKERQTDKLTATHNTHNTKAAKGLAHTLEGVGRQVDK